MSHKVPTRVETVYKEPGGEWVVPCDIDEVLDSLSTYETEDLRVLYGMAAAKLRKLKKESAS